MVPEAVALARYQATRERLSGRLFDATEAVASYDWDLAQLRALLRQVSSAMSDEVDHLQSLPDRRLFRPHDCSDADVDGLAWQGIGGEQVGTITTHQRGS